MPDVGRSDSQRSDSSQRPRVSFNRDVHIKRIGRSEGGSVAALTSDGEGHLVATPVRREKGQRSRSELAKEAQLILKHADQAQTITAVPPGVIPNAYNSLDRGKLRKRRTQAQQIFTDNDKGSDKFGSVRRLTRSVSDVGKSKGSSTRDDERKKKDKQLSIFATLDRRLRKHKDKDNTSDKKDHKQLSPILEDDNVGGKNNPFQLPPPKILIEPATPIPDGKYNGQNYFEVEQNDVGSKKFNRGSLSRRNVRKGADPVKTRFGDVTDGSGFDDGLDESSNLDVKEIRWRNSENQRQSPTPKVGKLEWDVAQEGNHSNWEKQKGVRRIVRELSQRDARRVSPPKSAINAMVDPAVDQERQHNMNRPFSYLQPNATPTQLDSDQVIYAEVVCSGGGSADEQVTKRTVHTTVDRRNDSGGHVHQQLLQQVDDNDNMRITGNSDSSSVLDLDHLSLRRDRLQSRINNHKRRFQKNVHNSSYDDNRYVVPMHNDTISTTDNLGSISDLTTKERYFEHHIKTTASFHRKQLLSDSNSVVDHKTKNTTHHHDNYSKQPPQLESHNHRQSIDKQSINLDDKAEKKSSTKKTSRRLDRVRQLVSWNKKNKSQSKINNNANDVDPVKARYVEYTGSNNNEENVENYSRKFEDDESSSRHRTPTPVKSESTWFKSLTRRHKNKDRNIPTPVPKDSHGYQSDRPSYSSKSLRFFGDSDRESIQSTNTLQPNRNSRVRPPPDSSAESTLEDESGQSQKSVVYLHAAAVGDIPGSKKLHRSQLSSGRMTRSREELLSQSNGNGSWTFVGPRTTTLSRSISLLAPWRPSHAADGIQVNYDDAGKPPKSPVKTTTKTPSKITPEKKKQKEATLSRRGSESSR